MNEEIRVYREAGPEAKVILRSSRESIVDWMAHNIRNRAYPEFMHAPPPEWATEAAENCWRYIETMGVVAAPVMDSRGVLEAALDLLAKNNIHAGLPNGYCAVCEGGCMLPDASA